MSARKLVPVVLTLRSPVGLPERTFWATAEASATASEERVARAWRWELARWASRSNFPGDGRSFRNSHGNPAPSLARAPLFWRWGLAPRNILALGSGRTGFPKQVSSDAKRGDVGRRRGRRGFKSMGQPMAVLSTIAGDPGSGRNGRFTDFALSRTSSLSTARSRQKPGPGASRTIFRDAKNHRRFGLGSGPSGCPKAHSHGKPAPSRNNFGATAEASATAMFARAPLFWRWGLVRRAFRNNFPGDGQSICVASVLLALGSGRTGFPKQVSERRKLPRQPWQTRAVVRARSVIVALGAGPSGFPKQFSRRRLKHLRQPPSRPLPSF